MIRTRHTLGAFGLAALTVAAMVVPIGCSSDDPIETKGAATERTTTSAGAGNASTTTADGAGSSVPSDAGFAALEARLITEVPDGFEQQADDVGDTGPSDLDKAVRDDGTPDARKELAAEGFVRGYQRLWLSPKEQQIIVFLYQFETPEGAAAAAKRSLGMFGGPGEETQTFTVDGIPGAEGRAGSGPQAGGSVVLFTSASYLAQIVTNASPQTELSSLTVADGKALLIAAGVPEALLLELAS